MPQRGSEALWLAAERPVRWAAAAALHETTRTDVIGKCHCGRVVFRVNKDVPTIGGRCNCSFCSRRGWIGSSAALHEFELIQGQEVLRCYRFGLGRSQNFFCGVCGVHTHFFNTYDDPPDYKYNLACCKEVELSELKIVYIDGRSY